MLGFVGRSMLGSIAGALLKPLLAMAVVPVIMTGFGSCTGAKHELRRANAAHRQTLERIGTLADESARLKKRADKERARADANKQWALSTEEQLEAEREYVEERVCPPSWGLPE